jgi:outer membrane protein assembly factor BamB
MALKRFETQDGVKIEIADGIVDENGDPIFGSGVVERSVSFPNGESGDTRGTIALTPNGETYICIADWEDAATGLQGTFSAVTVELYNIGQSGGIYNSAVLSIADEPEIYNILRYGSWSEGQFTVDAGVAYGGAQNVTSTGYNDQTGIMSILWLHRAEDPEELAQGSSVTIAYTGGGTQTPIWRRLVDLQQGGEGYGEINWRSEGDLTIETLRPQGYTGDCDLNLNAADDVFINANGDEVSIQAFTNVVIESDDGNHAWTFAQNGSLKLPSLNNTGYENGYSLNGPTLRLGGENDPYDQVIITGPEPDSNNASAQRLVIQGQRGYGTWNQPVAGEGGDVYIWGGVGGEGSDGGNYYGGSGGDIKIRGGQGQNNDGGYVKIEGGDTADWNNTGSTGGYIEINGGDGLYSNSNGGDVNIRGGRKSSGGTGNNGQVYIRTGVNSEHEWMFDNGGSLSLPTNGRVGFNNGYVGQDTTIDNNALRLSGGVDVGIYTNEDAKRWLFKTDGKLELPVGGDIVDSSGNSVLGAGADTNVWVQTFASDTVGDNVIAATSVEYDPDGNVIALFSHDDTNNSNRYISVAKFDTSGGKLWQQRFAAGQYSDGWGLAVDSTSIYVAGELEGTGGPAPYQVSSLMKLNTANGNVIWMKSYDFGEASYSQVVDVASDGNPVMVGHAYSGGQAFLTTTKVDKDTGNIIWSRKLDGQNGEYSYGMAVGPAGEIVVIGYMDNLGILNTAATLYSDPASNANWTQNTGGIAGGLTFAVEFTAGVPNFTSVVDPVGGRSVDDVLGTLSGTGFGGTSPADDMILKVGTVTPGDNSDRMLVVKYDSSGSIQWQKAIQYDAGFDCSGADADIDADGNIYVCGQYWKDNGAGGTTTAMSLLKMDGNGTKQWSRRTIGDCQDLATSVVVGPDNCLYLSGVTGSTGGSDYTFVIAKFTPLGSVVWQRLLDNTTTWTFGSNWFGNGGGSNIAVKSGYAYTAIQDLILRLRL